MRETGVSYLQLDSDGSRVQKGHQIFDQFLLLGQEGASKLRLAQPGQHGQQLIAVSIRTFPLSMNGRGFRAWVMTDLTWRKLWRGRWTCGGLPLVLHPLGFGVHRVHDMLANLGRQDKNSHTLHVHVATHMNSQKHC